MTPKWLPIIGVILVVVGAAWFLQSVGIGGGFAPVLVAMAGFCCIVAGIFLHLIKERRRCKRREGLM